MCMSHKWRLCTHKVMLMKELLCFRRFKVVYMLHYLVDILEITSSLCLEFQESFVDVITIEVLVMGAIRDI